MIVFDKRIVWVNMERTKLTKVLFSCEGNV